MLCKFGGVAVVSKGTFVVIVSSLFVLCMLSCNEGTLVYILLKVKICQDFGFCVLSGFVWWYLCGKLFLCLNV
jgi:hypothetical protein